MVGVIASAGGCGPVGSNALRHRVSLRYAGVQCREYEFFLWRVWRVATLSELAESGYDFSGVLAGMAERNGGASGATGVVFDDSTGFFDEREI